jgi:hypothetical protein
MKSEIETAVKTLSAEGNDQLYARLAATSQEFVRAPAKLSSPSASVSIDIGIAGPLDDAVDLGKRILKRWNRSIYDIVCGTPDADPQARKTIMDALKLNSPEALAAAITGVLIATFSVGPAVAAVVGVLFGKVLLPAAGEEVCKFWKEKL